MDLIRQAGGPILNKVELFDKFSSKKLGNEKSVAFHLTFLDRKKTLSDKDIEPLMKKISKNLVQKGYKIRS